MSDAEIEYDKPTVSQEEWDTYMEYCKTLNYGDDPTIDPFGNPM